MLEYMYFKMTCLMGTFVLREVMFLEDMSCRSVCLQDDISFRMMCPTGTHVLWKNWSYLRVCLIGGFV